MSSVCWLLPYFCLMWTNAHCANELKNAFCIVLLIALVKEYGRTRDDAFVFGEMLCLLLY
jgi:hypothetical protein